CGQAHLGGVDLIAVPGAAVDEPPVGGLGSLLGLGHDQALLTKDLVDRRPARHHPAASGPVLLNGHLLQPPTDVLRAVVDPDSGPGDHDLLTHLLRGPARARTRPARLRLPRAGRADPRTM